MNFESYKVVIIIPAYRVERDIKTVLDGIPDYIKHIIVVDDASPDSTADLITARCTTDPRLIIIRHVQNQGVGGAMISGFKKALDLNAQIVVKIDGDGQMDTSQIP